MTYLEYKQTVADFFTLVKRLNKPEQIDAGWKQVAIGFLQIENASANERYQAEILLTLASRKHDELQ